MCSDIVRSTSKRQRRKLSVPAPCRVIWSCEAEAPEFVFYEEKEFALRNSPGGADASRHFDVRWVRVLGKPCVVANDFFKLLHVRTHGATNARNRAGLSNCDDDGDTFFVRLSVVRGASSSWLAKNSMSVVVLTESACNKLVAVYKTKATRQSKVKSSMASSSASSSSQKTSSPARRLQLSVLLELEQRVQEWFRTASSAAASGPAGIDDGQLDKRDDGMQADGASAFVAQLEAKERADLTREKLRSSKPRTSTPSGALTSTPTVVSQPQHLTPSGDSNKASNKTKKPRLRAPRWEYVVEPVIVLGSGAGGIADSCLVYEPRKRKPAAKIASAFTLTTATSVTGVQERASSVLVGTGACSFGSDSPMAESVMDCRDDVVESKSGDCVQPKQLRLSSTTGSKPRSARTMLADPNFDPFEPSYRAQVLKRWRAKKARQSGSPYRYESRGEVARARPRRGGRFLARGGSKKREHVASGQDQDSGDEQDHHYEPPCQSSAAGACTDILPVLAVGVDCQLAEFKGLPALLDMDQSVDDSSLHAFTLAAQDKTASDWSDSLTMSGFESWAASVLNFDDRDELRVDSAVSVALPDFLYAPSDEFGPLGVM